MEKNKRHIKLQSNVKKQMEKESASAIQSLKKRDDYITELEPFLNAAVLSSHPEKLSDATENSLIGLFCIQAPFELFDAFNLRPFKFCGGSYTAQHLSTAHLPALTCPMIKSTMGILDSDDANKHLFKKIIVPTTCDWVVKFAELAEYDTKKIHFMELPHVKENEKGEERWLQEFYELKKLFEKITGRRLKRKKLLNSINKYLYAWNSFTKLVELRRKAKISAQMFTVIANAFPFMKIEDWTEKLEIIIEKFSKTDTPENINKHPVVYLAGAPVVFPNMKLLDLIEEAEMNAIADDLCSSERIFPGGTCYDDTSEYGLMKALADRYHKACICPTYADNERRINTIFNTLEKYNISGVVYHVLKGCHPYDIESITIEKRLKKYGYKFIKIETDYVEEDRQTILNRLEAFRNTL